MFGISACRIDAKLTQGLNNAIRAVVQLERNQSLCPIEAGDRLRAAESAWVEHKMTCRFCCGQQLGIVH